MSDGVTTLSLHDDMLWEDEFTWRAAETRHSYSVAGALLADVGVKLTGRPMTLVGGPDFAWTTRATVEQLFAWASMASVALVLTFRGVAYAVMFDQSRAPVEATPIFDYPEYIAGDRYFVRLHLIQR